MSKIVQCGYFAFQKNLGERSERTKVRYKTRGKVLPEFPSKTQSQDNLSEYPHN